MLEDAIVLCQIVECMMQMPADVFLEGNMSIYGFRYKIYKNGMYK